MEKELTNSEKAKVFAMYYGQLFKHDVYTGIIQNNGSVEHSFDNVMDKKIILTPLSDITDEHAVDVAKIVIHPNVEYPRTDYTITRNSTSVMVTINNDWYTETICIGIISGTVWMPEKSNARIGVNIYDKLRSWGYMLPYNGVDLFDAGIAIIKQ